MKKILFVLAVCVPSFAMNPSSYETRLENVETAVVEIKDVLDDKEDPGAGSPILGLKSKIDGTSDNPNLGLMNQMQNVRSILQYEYSSSKGKFTSTRIDDIETEVENNTTKVSTIEGDITEIKDVLNDKEDPGAGSPILGLKSKINGTETDPTLGLTFRVRQIREILEYIPNDPNTHNPTFGIVLQVNNLETDIDHIKNLLDYRIDPGGNPTSGLKDQVENNTTKVSTIEGDITEIKDVLNDKKSTDGRPILGLISKIDGTSENPNLGLMNQMASVQSILRYGYSSSKGFTFARIDDIETEMETLNKSFNDMKEKIDNYNLCMDEKFQKYIQEYMDVKKQVQDIIARCKANGQGTPAYITETSEQLQAMDLEMRRSTLSKILNKLKVFESLVDKDNNPLLDHNKLQTIQTYLDNTNVPKPNLKQPQGTLSYIVEGEYIKVTGATRAFTRSVGFKTGLPKESWMDQSYDYFAIGFLPHLKNVINSENNNRSGSDKIIIEANAQAQAEYDAKVNAAERVAFPADNLTTLINGYNQLLVRHEI